MIAGDSTKLRAQNSKKNNFNEGKIEKHLAYIDNKLDEYNAALAEADEDNKKIIAQEISKHQGAKTTMKKCRTRSHKAESRKYLHRILKAAR